MSSNYGKFAIIRNKAGLTAVSSDFPQTGGAKEKRILFIKDICRSFRRKIVLCSPYKDMGIQ
jgi:hypothetical protein